MSTILFTGFPGFLGSELLPRVLARRQSDKALCVIQKKFSALAKKRADELVARDPSLAGRIDLVEGDITKPDLALANAAALASSVVELFHLAAVYDLSVARDLAFKVNVEGTKHALDLAERCDKLERFHYVSTCYVSGRYAGIFRETDLEKGQEFNNFYEETKFLAEVEVQKRMRAGLSATIYRPAIVVGDSRTGATQKYDGPAYAIRWILKQPTVAVMPVAGDPKRTRLNVVPRDFVIAAMDYLAGSKGAAGRVYHLADPDPPTIDEILEAVGKATGKIVVQFPMPTRVAKGALDHVPGVYRLLQIPSASVDYFDHSALYDTSTADADLAPAGIRCPRFVDYLPNLVAFMKAHPEIPSEAMV